MITQHKFNIDEYGTKYWFDNTKIHRTDGPAIERKNGDKEWWIDGKLHRTDGPAIEHFDGHIEWWINGYRYPFKKWLIKCNLSMEETAELVLNYG